MFLAAFFGALFQFTRGEVVTPGAGFEIVAAARSLVRNRTFADPFFPAPAGPRPICRRRARFRSPSG